MESAETEDCYLIISIVGCYCLAERVGNLIQSHPILSNLIQSYPIPSNLIQSNPSQCKPKSKSEPYLILPYPILSYYLFIYLSIYLSVCLSIYQSSNQAIYPPSNQAINLPIYLPTYLLYPPSSMHPSIDLSNNQSIYLSAYARQPARGPC